MMITVRTKAKEIKRDWHLFDARGKILGRLASEIAATLIGKNKVCFEPHLDCGDFAVVINASEIQVTGSKEKNKIYYRHSGYSGGLKEIPLSRMRKEHPTRIIEHAVSGMLPKNKLRDQRMSRLKVFAGSKHPYDKIKFKNLNSKNN